MVYLDEEVIRQLYDAFNRRDFSVILKLYDDDVVLHCPGRNKLSGEYHGRDGVLEFWTKHMQISEGSYHPRVLSVVEGDENLVIITVAHVQRGEQTYEWRRILHFVLYNSRATECWIYEGDQYTADQAFG